MHDYSSIGDTQDACVIQQKPAAYSKQASEFRLEVKGATVCMHGWLQYRNGISALRQEG